MQIEIQKEDFQKLCESFEGYGYDLTNIGQTGKVDHPEGIQDLVRFDNVITKSMVWGKREIASKAGMCATIVCLGTWYLFNWS